MPRQKQESQPVAGPGCVAHQISSGSIFLRQTGANSLSLWHVRCGVLNRQQVINIPIYGIHSSNHRSQEIGSSEGQFIRSSLPGFAGSALAAFPSPSRCPFVWDRPYSTMLRLRLMLVILPVASVFITTPENFLKNFPVTNDQVLPLREIRISKSRSTNCSP